MLSRKKTSLNEISFNAAKKLIRDTLSKGVNIKKVRVDTVGPPEKYKDLLVKEFSLGIEFIVCAKADSIYPSVSAASIVAKVTRDRAVENWKFIEDKNGELFNKNFGCGYPSDPKTKTWLSEHADAVFGFPNMVRFSWKTTSNQLNDKIYKMTYEDYVEDEGNNTRKQFLLQQNKIDLSYVNKKLKYNYLEENKLKIYNFDI
jgi:ribonuclease H2 subunit A